MIVIKIALNISFLPSAKSSVLDLLILKLCPVAFAILTSRCSSNGTALFSALSYLYCISFPSSSEYLFASPRLKYDLDNL